ncbi:SWIM zinc finger family protein [Cystobacter fuscus]|uniref:SWIM zinc finger family protein n=1 Tax=Cystobacter fuscus TaxID=43 RepID=UPI002B31CFF5|nr:SWIM zinc finger family protein [Cystobacter fuscus]
MAPPLTSEQALALAPDSSVAASGQKLAREREWKLLGLGERAAWGECQGSALYQVRIDLSDLTPSCTCPSRKIPCKHCIGLLLLLAAERLPQAATPAWVEEWLTKRSAAAERKAAKKAAPAAEGAAPVDTKARAKRASERQERMARGMDALGLWMEDLVRGGLARLDTAASVHEQAARLVDAESPGLAAQLRLLAGELEGRPEPRRLVERLGRIALVVEAWRKLEQLPEPLAADVQARVGAPLRDEDVLARGERLQDTWAVVSQELDDSTHVREQRTWLLGTTHGRTARVLQFAVGASGQFSEKLIPGTAFDAELVYWPSAAPQRAKVLERRGDLRPWTGALPSLSLDTLQRRFAEELARQPFQERVAAMLGGVVPVLENEERMWLRDATGSALRLGPCDRWKLLALSGGHPVDVFGEWDGERLRPLSVLVDGTLYSLGGGAR